MRIGIVGIDGQRLVEQSVRTGGITATPFQDRPSRDHLEHQTR
jgi:hypothetical protein